MNSYTKIRRQNVHLSELLFQKVRLFIVHLYPCRGQYTAGIFLHIRRHTAINPNGLPVLVYVRSEVLFSCRTHILNQECRISAKNRTKADGIATTVLLDFILFDALLFFVFGRNGDNPVTFGHPCIGKREETCGHCNRSSQSRPI